MAIHSYEGMTPTSSHSEPEIGATLDTANSHETAPAPPRGGDVGEFDQNLPVARSREDKLQGMITALGEAPSNSLPQGAGSQATRGSSSGVAQPTLGPGAARGQLSIDKPLPEKPLPALPGPPPSVGADPYGRYMARSGVAPHISIHGDVEFHQDVDDALRKISQSPSGKKLIDDFQGSAGKGNSLTIRETLGKISASAHLNARQAARYRDLNFAEGNAKATQLAQKQRLGFKGEGTNAEIMWSPNKSLRLNAEGRPTGVVEDNSESHLALAHEMIHARRFVKGTSTAGKGDPYDPSTPAGKEELRAVGIGSKANQKRVSENSIRQELGYPLRTGYKPVQE